MKEFMFFTTYNKLIIIKYKTMHYKFPPSFTKKDIKKFFKDRNNFLHKELNKNIKNNKMYSILLDKIFENIEQSKLY